MKFLPSFSKPFMLALFMLSLAGPSSHVFAQPAGHPSFEAALNHFNRARAGNTGELDTAIAAFQTTPDNPALKPLYTAYLGSARTLQGKAAWLPWKKLKLTEQGLDDIDQALAALRPDHDGVLVQGTPVSLATRMVAAATFVAVPDSLFHRRAAGKTLLAELRRSPLSAPAPTGFQAELAAIDSRLKEAEK